VRSCVMANGICRTDWALWSSNFWSGGPRVSAPFVLGHEFAGVVEEVGSEVRRWHVGDRVTFPMNPGDGECATCRAGHQHVCEHGDMLVPGVSYWGAFAEYTVSARRVAPVTSTCANTATCWSPVFPIGARSPST
jgi:D-arabinose 1-dehydrogenase-like Zn-dependent alcohol dehydrogenase